jgi:hypothetical protein
VKPDWPNVSALEGSSDRSRIAARDSNASIAAHFCHNLEFFHRLNPSRHFYYLKICKVTGNESMANNRLLVTSSYRLPSMSWDKPATALLGAFHALERPK